MMGIVLSAARAIQLASDGYENNPFVACGNLGRTATLSGTTPVDGGERANAVTESTYDKWRAIENGSGGATLQFDFGTATAIQFAALVAHNVGTLGAAVAVQYSSDALSWTSPITAVSPDDDTPIAWRFAVGTSSRYWRFLFSDIPSGEEIKAGIAFLGNEIIIPTRLYQGFAPVLTPTEVQLQSNVSIGGELLGSSVISRGSSLSADITLVPAEFIRSTDWLAFQRSFGEGKGFFFGWRPDKYPQDIHYCWRSGDVIRPSNTGPRDYMGINFAARVHENG
jgi:hypothetical protein